MTKKINSDITESEEIEKSSILTSIIQPEKLALYDEYTQIGLNAQGGAYLLNHYDIVLFNAADYDYYYGTVAANAFDALKPGGHLIFNLNGSVLDTDKVISVSQLFFEYLENESRDGYYVFKKAEKVIV
jgi:hypothetical protein